MKIYTYKNCFTCRKATKLLEAKGISFEELPIRETPPSRPELEKMLGYYEGDLRRLFNTAGGDYRELSLKDRLPDMTQEEAFEILSSRGNLVKRPFLIGKDFGLVGFKEAEWAESFDE